MPPSLTQPSKIFLIHGRKSSRCHFCPPSTVKSRKIKTPSPNFRSKLQLQGCLEIFLHFRFKLEPDENGEEDDENHNAP
jgi:hypothetical protein